jgi:anti-sigma regulatory factor (Ser/Thr protein kinase)
MKELIVGARIENLYSVQGFISGELEAAGCPEDDLFIIDFAVVEIFVNIAKHAYSRNSCQNCPTPAGRTDANEGDVLIRVSVADEIEVVFEDEGTPFNPLEREGPDINAELDNRENGGLGIFSTRIIMKNNVQYRHEAGKNILTIRKQVQPGGA